MMFLSPLSHRLSPRVFCRLCLVLAALVFIGIYPGFVLFGQKHLPREMAPSPTHYDFVQYYIGAEVVRHGLWDALYPNPKMDVYANPPLFTPVFKTFLFDASTIRENPAFYPAVNLPEASDVSPKLMASVPQSAHTWRYIYPPPSALLLWPLSFASFNCAGGRLWPILCLWSYFLLSLYASRIHRVFRESPSYTEGLIVLACLVFTYRGRTDLNTGNITPILSALIAMSVYVLMQGRLLAFSCALIPLLLFKMLGLSWLPLLILRRFYWRAVLYLAIITLFLNGLVVGLAGVGVYEKFFSLSSKIIVPAGFGIVPSLLHQFGYFPHKLYLGFDLVVLALIYGGYWRKTRAGITNAPQDGRLILPAAMAGAMALYCLINFSVWFTYCPNYLVLPFLGWILQEGWVASGAWRLFILTGTALAYFVVASEWFVNGSLFYVLGPESVGWYHLLVFQPFFFFLIPAFFLLVAIRRLLFAKEPPPHEPVGTKPEA